MFERSQFKSQLILKFYEVKHHVFVINSFVCFPKIKELSINQLQKLFLKNLYHFKVRIRTIF